MKEKLRVLYITILLVCTIFVALPAKTNAATQYKNQYVKKNGQLFFYDKNGKLAKGFFVSPGKKLYYFDSKTGAVKSGLQKINNYYYIINSKGAIQTGWVTYNGKQYYCNSKGIMHTGWLIIQNKRYFFAKNGTLAKGFFVSPGKRLYYFDSKTGVVKSGLQKINNYYYITNSKGAIQTGWVTYNGKQYYCNSKGIVQTGWLTYGKNTYYLDEKTGVKQTGWLKKNGNYYCLHSVTGALKRNTFVNGKYIGPDGYWILHPEKVFYSIMGTSSVSVSQMVNLYNSRGAKYPAKELKKGGAGNIETFCKMLLEEAALEGVKPEVLYAQIMLETGWLRFGGDVSVSQFNFGGIGATGGGVSGNTFLTVRQGIRAQVQHLKAYASTDPLKKLCIDPRFTYVVRGKTPYVEWLGIQENPYSYGWAASQNYGYFLRSLINELIATRG